MSRADGYKPDLAYIHDTGFGTVAANAAVEVQQALRGRSLGGLIVDLGCGSGILARELLDAGYEVLGIDQSAAMIALAKKRAPGGQFRHESFMNAMLPPSVAVCAIGEVFNYLFDRGNSAVKLQKVFGRIHDALCPGGFLMFDVATPGRIPGPGRRQSFHEGKDWLALVDAGEDRQQNVLTRRIISFRKVGELYRRDEEVHRQRLMDSSQVVEQLRDVGFRVRLLSGYGQWRFPAGVVGFLARKR